MEKDSRFEHLETQPYLRDVRWRKTTYKAPRPDWDHDHCLGCWAEFMEADSPTEATEHEGYATTDEYPNGAEYEWVCNVCFATFKDAMGWSVV